MPVLKRVTDGSGGEYRRFHCPGCKTSHRVSVGGAGTWSFNGDEVRPTFSPSVLITTGHFLLGHEAGQPCWCSYNRDSPERPAPFHCYRCHSFVRDGQIQFLSDCSHELAGLTVPLPELP